MGEGDKGLSPVETPVNPYSLLEAVNAASDTVNRGWLFFLALMAYVLITVAGVTHKDLLLDAPVVLPALQASIPLKNFFTVAPVVVLLFHLGIVAQLVLLARKALEFDKAVRGIEPSDKRSHALRLELSNFFFVQAIAGPERSRVISGFLHGMSWLTTMILPVLLLLFIQVAFLPFHDQWVTLVHRIVLLLDFLVLFLMGTFLMSTETTFLSAMTNNARRHPFNVAVTTLVILFVGFLSFFVATIPGERLDQTAQVLFGAPGADTAPRAIREGTAGGPIFKLFHRNLIVSDADLVAGDKVVDGEVTLNLRGRDLRYAQLDRSDLHGADLTGANISYASLEKANLRGATLVCQGSADLPDNQSPSCTNAKNAIFSAARLHDARLNGINLAGADLVDAVLEDAILSRAILTGADLGFANLSRAVMFSLVSEGANFNNASLQGANIVGADLQGANLSSADLRSADLERASLQGALLREADFEGANLKKAKLYGADLSGAKVTAADFRRARIWLTLPPSPDTSKLANFRELQIAAPDESEMTALKKRAEGLQVEGEARKRLEPLIANKDGAAWSESADAAAWKAFEPDGTEPADTYARRLSEHLADMMCNTRGFGAAAVATGIMRRAIRANYDSEARAVYERAIRDDCKGAKSVSAELMSDLAAAAEAAGPLPAPSPPATTTPSFQPSAAEPQSMPGVTATPPAAAATAPDASRPALLPPP
jgi:uncharacterized protein YjbI with pentapeptide repeats